MIEFNAGTWIYDLFNLIIGFFSTLYTLLGARLVLPQFFVNIVSKILPNLSIPDSISILGLLSVVGVPIALAISIYYIFKSPI